MTSLTRQELLSILRGDWAEYVQRFRGLPPETQSLFLIEQGYARFADLLSHVVAWWQAGYQSVEKYLDDPTSQPEQYDVDAFNAAAVQASAGLDEVHVIESFEEMRKFLIEFVKELPDAAFRNEKVINQLNMDLVGHLHEHKISESE